MSTINHNTNRPCNFRPASLLARAAGTALAGLALSCHLAAYAFTDSTNVVVNAPVPDNDPVGVASTVVVNSPLQSLTNLQVTLNVTGSGNGDLYAFLLHDSGFVVLLNRPGMSESMPFGYGDGGFDVTFDDNATNNVHTYRFTLFGNDSTPLTGPLTGSWVPDGRDADPLTVSTTNTPTTSLSAFNGLDPNGEWALFVADMSRGDLSTLVSWGLQMAGTAPFVPLSVTVSPDATNAECAGSVVLTANATGTGYFTYQWYDNQTNALPSQTTATLTLNNLHPADSGNYSVVVTDWVGSVTNFAAVTVTDTTAPVVTLNGDNPATVECHGSFTDPGATANDTCVGSVTVTVSGTVDPNVPGTYTLTYSATDGAANTGSTNRTVYVADTTAPVVTLNGDSPMTVECHGSFADPGATANDACAGSVPVTVSGTVDANTPGTYTLTYSATDGAANIGSTNRTVNVVDTTAPVITWSFTNLTLAADASCQALMPDVTGTNYILPADICSAALTITQTPTNNAVLALGSNEVVLAVADGNGNTAYSTNTVIVADQTAPTVTLLGVSPVTNECHSAYEDAGATASDGCSGVTLSTNGTVNAEVTGVYTISYIATDGAGNSATNTRTVYVVDTVAPVVTLNGDNPITVECHGSFTDPGATANDACAGSVAVTVSGTVDANTPGTYTLTYSTTDGAANTGSANRTVYVVDTTAPVITWSFTNLTLAADTSCQALMPDVTGTNYILSADVCSAALTITQTPTNNTVLALGSNEVVLAVADGNGNTAYSTNTVIVADQTAPTVTALGVSPVTNECHSAYEDAGATASDDCSGVTLTTNGTVNVEATGVYTISYIATDGAGNSATNTRTVYVVDTVAPVVTVDGDNLMTVECHGSFADPGATANDACAGSVTVTVSGTVDANTPGTYTLTYSATDGAANTGSANRTVYVVDTTAPVITWSFTNLTLAADTSCQALMPDVTGTNYILSADVCSAALTITQTPTNNTVLALGSNEVVLAVADGNGNTAYSTNTVIVADQTAPTIVLLGASPVTNECHSAYEDAGATASDDCSGATLSTNGTVNVEATGVYTITYIATDGAGNSATNTRTVYVVDTVAPVVTLNGDNPMTVECHGSFTDPGATADDACAGSVTVTVSGTVDANTPGTYTLTYSATDGAANTGSANRTVYVVDTTPPVITQCAPPQELTADSGGQVTLSNLTTLVVASDACSGAVHITQEPAADTQLGVGTNTVVFLVDDGNGNTNTCSTVVVVTTATLVPPTMLSQAMQTDGTFYLSFSGPQGQHYQVVGSEDVSVPLSGWDVLGTGTFGSAAAEFTDADAPAHPLRFYRVILP